MPKAKSRPIILLLEDFSFLDDFERFWVKYPRKIGKGHARRAFAKALTKTSVDTILAAIQAQQHAGMFSNDPLWVAHPGTWLNGERWSDEIVPALRPTFRNGALELLAREAEMWPEPIDGAAEDMRYLGAPDA